MADFLTLSGWVAGVLSLLFAGYQWWRTKKLAERNKEQLRVFLTLADHVSFEHELIDEVAPKLNDYVLMRYLVSQHQAGCDLYKALVDFYLSLESRFTYDDLKRICDTPLVNYKWQEGFWRSLLCLRRENRAVTAPEPFLKENKTPRYKTYTQTRDGKLQAIPNASRSA